MRRLMMAGLTVLSLSVLVGCAQQETVQEPIAVEASSNKPGKVSTLETLKVSAVVAAVDPVTRTVTLKNAKGKSFNVVAGDDVKNFEQIKVKDRVIIRYVKAVTLQVRKKGDGIRKAEERLDVERAALGEKPAISVSRELTIIADVIKVSKKKKMITLKAPEGKIIELAVKNADHFKVVKVGDQVEVDYVEATAISVEPAKKKSAKK